MTSNVDDELLRDHKRRMEKIARQNREAKYRADEEKARQKYKKKTETSKVVLAIMFTVCIEIIFYSQWAMYRLGDLTALITLLGIPACMTAALISYFNKSAKQNTRNGITYELAMLEKQQELEGLESDDEEAVG